MMSAESVETLAGLVRAKRHCLAELCALESRQFESIEADDVNRLLDLLSVKHRLIERLQTVERALMPFRDQPPETRRWPNAALRDACAADLAECERLLAALLRDEKRCEQTLVCRRDEAARQLHGAHHAARARDAYFQGTSGAGQLDLTSDH